MDGRRKPGVTRVLDHTDRADDDGGGPGTAPGICSDPGWRSVNQHGALTHEDRDPRSCPRYPFR